MKVKLADNLGYCFGVKRAVTGVLKEKGNLHTLGMLVHNKKLVSRLKKRGVKVASELSEIKKGTLVIRAHGVSASLMRTAAKKGLKIVDLTCPFVKKLQYLAKELHKKGYFVFILGDKEHPEIREIFIPEDGKIFIIADYSQIEFRLAAHFSKDIAMLNGFREGGDFHGKMAIDIFDLKCSPEDVKSLYPDLREIAKTGVYLTIYGGSTERYATMLQEKGIQKSEKECKALQAELHRAAPALKEFKYKIGYETEKLGYVTSLYGRKLGAKYFHSTIFLRI